LQQAVILAVLGYVPATLASLFLYRVVGEAIMLPIYMTPERAIGVLALSIGMCSFAGVVALRKVRAADPADIF
jgi:putative ABC transport system permease protein